MSPLEKQVSELLAQINKQNQKIEGLSQQLEKVEQRKELKATLLTDQQDAAPREVIEQLLKERRPDTEIWRIVDVTPYQGAMIGLVQGSHRPGPTLQSEPIPVEDVVLKLGGVDAEPEIPLGYGLWRDKFIQCTDWLKAPENSHIRILPDEIKNGVTVTLWEGTPLERKKTYILPADTMPRHGDQTLSDCFKGLEDQIEKWKHTAYPLLTGEQFRKVCAAEYAKQWAGLDAERLIREQFERDELPAIMTGATLAATGTEG